MRKILLLVCIMISCSFLIALSAENTDEFFENNVTEVNMSDTAVFEILDLRLDYDMRYIESVGSWYAQGYNLHIEAKCKNLPNLWMGYCPFGDQDQNWQNYWRRKYCCSEDSIVDEIVEYDINWVLNHGAAVKFYSYVQLDPDNDFLSPVEYYRTLISDLLSTEDYQLIYPGTAASKDVEYANGVKIQRNREVWSIASETDTHKTIEIMTVNGATIRKIESSAMVVDIQPSELPQGIVLLRITDEKETQTFKIFNRP